MGDAKRFRLAGRAGRLGRLFARRGRIGTLPPPLSAWTRSRDLPTPPTETFRDWWTRPGDRTDERRPRGGAGADPHGDADATAVAPTVPRDYAEGGTYAPGSAEAVDLLADRLVDYRATVTGSTTADVAQAVREALGGARRYVVPPGLPAEWIPTVGPEAVTDEGAMTPADLDEMDAVVTAATVACAVTGTIVLDGSPDQGRRAITLVPDLYVCVVRPTRWCTRCPRC